MVFTDLSQDCSARDTHYADELQKWCRISTGAIACGSKKSTRLPPTVFLPRPLNVALPRRQPSKFESNQRCIFTK